MIDLGKTMEGPTTAPQMPEKGEKHYPCLYIDGGKELDNLPDEGTCTMRFKVASRNTSKQGGETKHSITLEALDLDDVSETAPKANDRKQAEDGLDKMAEEKVAKKKKSKPADEEDSY